MTLHINTLRTTRDAYLARLAEAGIAATASTRTKNAVLLKQSMPVAALPGMEEGLFFVQDEASQICIETLDPQPGEHIIDCCACPGGKSFAIAIAMKNNGSVKSFDLHENKLRLISNGAQRLGIQIITTAVHDGSVYDAALENSADRILCDVPCSGLGVIAKKPDLRYKDAESLRRLPEVQFGILQNNARYLKPNGTLVYSTCTINHCENEDVVERFLALHPEFTQITSHTFYPDIDHTDGFFIAKLQKHEIT